MLISLNDCSPQLCVGFLFLILYSRAPPSPSPPPAPPVLPLHTLCQHRLCQHTLCQHTLCQHTLSTYTLSTHSVNKHFVTTYFVNTHFVNIHFVNTHSVNTHFVTTYFVNIHFVNTLPLHTLCQHRLCQHTLVNIHFVNIHFVNTLCQQTLSHYILCQHTLCQHTLCQHTLCQHTLCHYILCQHTLCQYTLSTHTLSTFVSRGRRGTNSHSPSFHVAGVARTHIHRRFVWQAWDTWHRVARLDWLGRLWRRGTLRGRRGTNSHLLSFHVAGVAQTRIHRRFAWQAWDTWHWVARLDWLGRLWRRGTLRGRRGTNSHLLSFHVAGVAQTRIHRRFAWQAWDTWHWVARLDWLGRLWRRGILRGRRGTNSHPLTFHVAGVAQTRIHRRFAWQAWDTWHWVARLDWLGRLWRRGTLRGRRGTNSHPLTFHVAGVAQTRIHRRFAWQAWDTWHWVARLDWLGRLWRRGTLRGRRGTNSHLLSFHVAGVAQTRIHRRFAWQAWDTWHWVARLGWLGRLWRRGILRQGSMQTACRLLRYNSCRSTGKHACSLPEWQHYRQTGWRLLLGLGRTYKLAVENKDYMLFVNRRAVRRYIWCYVLLP